MTKPGSYLLLFLLTLASCSQENSSKPAATLPFFDLSGYISATVRDSQIMNVKKSVIVDQLTETKNIDHYKIWQDIKQFDAYDINRPALFDKYLIDTIIEGDSKEISYHPTAEDLKVRLLKVQYEHDQVTRISINTVFSSFLEDVTLDIEWAPEDGYMIHRSSDKLLGATTNQVINVQRR
jgi:hypothetical protein